MKIEEEAKKLIEKSADLISTKFDETAYDRVIMNTKLKE
jgi:hypothetical protein